MGTGIRLRANFSLVYLRSLSRRSKDAKQSRRLLALSAVTEGRSRAEAARAAELPRIEFETGNS